MWLCILLLGTVVSLRADSLRSFIHKEDHSGNDNAFVKQNISSGYSQINDANNYRMVPDGFEKFQDNENFKTFFSYVGKGITEKGLIFNLYEEGMRNATESLFRLFRETRLYNRTDYNKIKEWANINVNDDMLDYVKRLTALYSNSYISEDIFLPPFLVKPNYFVNGEAIVKALYIKNNYGKICDTVLKNYQAEMIANNTIALNTNYSGWNIPLNGCDSHISYFKDDVALNSYYYGLHLLHPFWIANAELDGINPDHAEHYYFVHQQLLARFYLEKKNSKKKVAEDISISYDLDLDVSTSNCNLDYNPYLYYENGLDFPIRSSRLSNVDERWNYIKTLDNNIRNDMHLSLHFMNENLCLIETENGTYVTATPDNYINLKAKYVRLGVDGTKSATVLRSIFGYGNNGYPDSKQNPTPSAMHHPQTSLRDPAYWLMIEIGLNYFSEFLNTINYNLSVYETDEINITGAQFSKITTIFEYFHVNLGKSLGNTKVNSDINVNIFSRLRRLNHLPFTLNFNVESKTQKDVIVRLFLGPQCEVNDCWNLHLRFFELDCYRYKLDEGLNTVSWSPQNSNRYSNNKEENDVYTDDDIKADYNIYEFPQNLIIPKGLKEGLNLTIFIMITEDFGQNDTYGDKTSTRSLYHKITNKLDKKPFGFPFHQKVQFSNGFGTNAASNYKFFNFTVFHKKDSVDKKSGYFSPNLY